MESFVSHIAGKAVAPQNQIIAVEFEEIPGGNLIDRFFGGSEFGRATGSQRTYQGEIWVQITTYKAWEKTASGFVVNPLGKYSIRYGWVRKSDIQFINSSYQIEQDGDGLIENLGNQDYQIANILNLTSNVIRLKKSRGVNVSSHEQTLKALVANLTRRQKKVKESNLVGFKQDTDNLWNKIGLGALPLVPALIIFASGAVAAVTLYFVFKPDYDESKRDLEISKLLQQALNNLSPAEQVEVIKDLETQVDKAYNSGKTDGFFGGALKFGSGGLLLGAGALLVYLNREKLFNGRV